MPEFHRLDDAINNHGGAEPGPQTEKQHRAAVVTSERLHGGVIHDLDRSAECGRKIEAHPSAPQIVWLANRPTAQDWSGIANRDYRIVPVGDQFEGSYGPSCPASSCVRSPEESIRRLCWPLTKSFTDVPPISITSTFFGTCASFAREPARFCRASTSTRTIDVFTDTPDRRGPAAGFAALLFGHRLFLKCGPMLDQSSSGSRMTAGTRSSSASPPSSSSSSSSSSFR